MTTPATFDTPAGWIERCARWDDDAEHQIRILIVNSHRLHVTCLCRDEPIAPIRTIEEALAVYASYHEKMS